MTEIQIEHVDADRWTDLETLFGRAGADNGCWCQYWLLGAGYHHRDRAENRHDLQSQAGSDRAGLLAYQDGRPVGWARLTPRAELTWLGARFSAFEFTPDDAWSLPCFFIARSAQGSGVMRALIRFAAEWGRARNVPIEAYPIDVAAPGATRNRFTGVLPAFLDEGFVVAGRLSDDRVVVTTGEVARL
ncbi:GNAT family N-acetyltransferase [Microbacterium pumilum]|uniref:N-acetyltransferase domain-containing protein n=1 Tax=Microbacterium pumilum TaxID=344165 RepID=A0ABN2S7H5_9MICO